MIYDSQSMRFAVTKLLYVVHVLPEVLSYFRTSGRLKLYFRTVTRCTLYVYVYPIPSYESTFVLSYKLNFRK
jgi:hypothetical protein